MAKDLKKGLFIAFEGGEGCGKSTLLKKLIADLKKDGYRAFITSEPGGTKLGAMIREILLLKKDIRLSPSAELFLFEADRAQHVAETIRPALGKGFIVLGDRFSMATFAYQGYGLGMDMGLIKRIDALATGGLEPDLVILLDVDVSTGLARAMSRGGADKMETRGFSFHKKVRAGYLALAAKKRNVRVIKATESIEKVYASVKKAVYEFIGGHKRTK